MNRKRIHKEQTDSTNNDIRLLASQGALEGTIVTADVQTAGKGRRGRNWQAESGTSLLFSLLLRPAIAPDIAPQITLLMAMAVTKAVRELTGLEAMIKWPNDVVVNRKKVCGILTEMQLKDGAIDHVVVGTGINMNQTSIPEDLISSATSLWLEMKETGAASLRLEMNESSACDGGVSKVSERVLQFLDRDELLECILEVFE